MKYLKFAYHLFCKRVVMSCLLILQLATAFLLLQGMIVYTSDKYTSVETFVPLSNHNALHFSTEYAGDLEPLFQSVKSIRPDVDIISGSQYFIISNYAEITFYDPELVKYYQPHMKQGTWLSENLSKDMKNIPVVTFSPHKLGERFDNAEGVRFEVVGIIDEDCYLSFSSYGYDMNTQMFMPSKETVTYLALKNPENTKKLQLDTIGKSSVYLFMTESEEPLSAVEALLQEYGYVNSFDKVLKNGKNTAFEQFRVILPFFIFAYVLSLFGMISGVVLTVVKNMNMFAVMYTVGATRTQCAMIVLIDIVLHIAAAVVLYKTATLLFFNGVSGMFEDILFASIIACCIFTLIVSVIPINMLRKNNILRILRNG